MSELEFIKIVCIFGVGIVIYILADTYAKLMSKSDDAYFFWQIPKNVEINVYKGRKYFIEQKNNKFILYMQHKKDKFLGKPLWVPMVNTLFGSPLNPVMDDSRENLLITFKRYIDNP